MRLSFVQRAACGSDLDCVLHATHNGFGSKIANLRDQREYLVGLVRADVYLGFAEPNGLVHLSGADDDIYIRARWVKKVDDGGRCNYRLCLRRHDVGSGVSD